MTRAGILAGVGAGLVAGLALMPATRESLAALSALRSERATLALAAAAPAAPTTLLVTGQSLNVADQAAGRAAIETRVQALSKANGLLVEKMRDAQSSAALAAVSLRISGQEKALLSFIDTLEREQPLMRMQMWRIEPVGSGVRLHATIVAAWQ